jgi:hypothetical protein
MKFLSKNINSPILTKGLIYLNNNGSNNKKLCDSLLAEQKHFCAYTEKYIINIDSIEVEHFNSSKKYTDDYFNYYAVIRKANQYKISKDNQYKGNKFFTTLFFQDPIEFNARIQFIKNQYEVIDETDIEAKEFIDFLGLNNEYLYNERRKHVNRLKDIFHDAGYSEAQQLNYFRSHPSELNFVTAIESELGLNLTEFYSDLT